MDIDGPEFIADVNDQIANFRASSTEETVIDEAYARYIDDIEMSYEIREFFFFDHRKEGA